MHLHFERNLNAKCDCAILSLTWMGKVPDELPEDEGWKLNRTNYYQEGWLATGHIRGIVGVTFTTSHCKKSVDFPLRTNYNLRGHRSEVILVKWNEPYQKLASCDSSGIIFVWIKYEGRWSIELINDRNTPVTNFAWSHDGRMALICYQDGFVLVGSVAGQRYWSSMLSLESTITCGIWTPDDLQVYFGTSQGGIVVMDVHGAMVAQVSLAQAPVTSMAWSCEKFKMEESDDSENTDNSNLVLAVSLSTGCVFLMKSYDDVSPITFHTGLNGPLYMEWSNSKQLLAVAGVATNNENKEYVNVLKCYTEIGELLYSTIIPYSQSPVTALTWGHNDKRLFVATGGVVHIAWVSRRVASLQLLSRLKVASTLSLGESSVQNLPLPSKIKHLIGNLFAQTIKCVVPETKGLREFVSRAPVNGTRLHCTMIKHGDENLSFGTCYTLYLEYLGGLVPLLKGKRTSKIRPEFVIFDPQMDGEIKDVALSNLKIMAKNSDTSDTEREEGCSGSPRAQRKRKKRRRSLTENDDDIPYVDTLPEDARLAEVTSNIWGTKFKIHGLADCLPANLGQVTYKTSLLHLQPRQMSLIMTELSDDLPHSPDPSFNPKVFSEDEEEERNILNEKNFSQFPSSGPNGAAIPIAPMTPKREENRSRSLNSSLNKTECSGNNYFGSSRLMYKNPSLLKDLTESRKPLNHTLQCTNDTTSVTIASDIHRESEACCSKVNQRELVEGLSNGNLSFQIYNAAEKVQGSQPSKFQPSTYTDLSIPNTYQSVRSQTESKNKHGSAGNSIKKQECGDQELTDPNLSESNNVSENLKIGDLDRRKKATHLKFWQEKNETSFLNHQTTLKSSVKTQNPQSPKNTIAPCSVFCEIGVSTYSTSNTPIQNIQKMKNTFGKCLNHEKLEDESKNVLDRMSRSCSVGYLDDVDTGLIPCPLTLKLLQKDSPKRLILVGDGKKNFSCKPTSNTKNILKKCGKSKSLDSGELLLNTKYNYQIKKNEEAIEFNKEPLVMSKKIFMGEANEENLNERKNISASLVDSINTTASPMSPKFPRSQPVTPAMSKKKRNLSSSPIRKHLLNSPLLRRRSKSKAESSDDDNGFSGDEAFTSSSHFKDLETFQKAQLRQKLKRGKVRDGCATPKIRELIMHNKAPMWNENSQVYQLDFGGRVTQESAKNFQIEFKGKQVMQFGRIDGNAYTLDFQYPFSVLQAFSVALANVTQRLK